MKQNQSDNSRQQSDNVSNEPTNGPRKETNPNNPTAGNGAGKKNSTVQSPDQSEKKMGKPSTHESVSQQKSAAPKTQKGKM